MITSYNVNDPDTISSSMIDKKKTPQNASTSTELYKQFIIDYVTVALQFVIYVIIFGSLLLYITKTAIWNNNQSTCIPILESKTFDFTTRKIVTNVQTANFIAPIISAQFVNISAQCTPETFKNSLYLFQYITHVYHDTILKDSTIMPQAFTILSKLPDFGIMLCGLFIKYILVALYIINFCISVFYHIMHVMVLIGPTPDRTWFGLFTSLLILFFGWWVVCISIIVTPIMTTLISIGIPLTRVYNNCTTNKPNAINNATSFILGAIYFNRELLLIVALLKLFYNAINVTGPHQFELIGGVVFAIIIAVYVYLKKRQIK